MSVPSTPSTDHDEDKPATAASARTEGPGAAAVADAPRGVIRGERFPFDNPCPGERVEIHPGHNGYPRAILIPLPKEEGEPCAALTDYLNTTFPFIPSEANIIHLVRNFRLLLGDAFGSLQERRGGLHGYRTSFTIGETGALLAFGGQRDTAFVSLPGTACGRIDDWHQCCHLFRDIMPGRITRWDGAVDVFDGVPSVDDAVAFYKAGFFNSGGNKPSCNQMGNWIEPDGTGRTFYVGKRKNGKLLRVYEKGKQLGDPQSPWVRWEIELHNTDRVIPWEVLLEPGKYVAGAYPATGWVDERQKRVRTIQRSIQISYGHLSYYARQSYGPLLDVMLKVEGSAEKVMEKLRRPGVPARLDCGGLPPARFLAGESGENKELPHT